jgi:HYDIN/CFA65/VesB family protein
MRAAATLTAVALALASTLAGIQLATSGPAGADEITVSQNLSRDGWDSSEAMLSPAAVTGKSFGQIFDTPVNGQVFAQPLNVGNSVLVATENDYVYSINRNTGTVNWSRQLGSPYAAATENCGQAPVVLPYIGATSAPVYDPASGTLYVSGMLSGPPGDDTDMGTANPTYWLFALDEKTGAIKWKQQIKGSPKNNSGNTFVAAKQMQRTGLLLLNGSVYMGFGALCADGAANHNYVGYIVRVSTATGHAETLWSDQAADLSMTGFYGGIWQGGGGLVSDGHSVYFSTGNGTPPGLGIAGSAAPSVLHLGQSMVKLNVQGTGPMQAADFFSPGDAATMNATDHDFGSGGPILLPFTTSAYPHGLFATADKEAVIYLLDKDNLGGSSSSATGSTAVYTSSQSLVNDPGTNVTAHGLWGHMAAAAFSGTGSDGLPNDYIYYEGTGWGSTDNMYALKFDGTDPSAPALDNVGASAKLYGFSSGSPVITSNGTDPNSAIVWEVHADTNSVPNNGSLDAYSALPVNGVLQQIWTAPIGNAAQFTIPATSNGRIYVGARNDASAATANASVCPTDFESAAYASPANDSSCVGEVYGFGNFSAQLAGSTVNFGNVALGKAATKTVTLTNTGDTPVTITSVTTPTVPFGTPAGGPALNHPIARGASVSFPVTFTPQARGTTTGTYTVTTTDGFTAPRTTTVTVTGTGAAPAGGTTVVPSPGGGWTLNGSATMVGTTLRLTSAASNTSGSAVFYQRLASNGLKATFTARLSGGTGADGLTFALLDPSKSTVSSLGTGGGNLGFGGLSGAAVVLGTYKGTGDPSGNFIGIATGTANRHLAFAATSTKVPNLRSATHVIGVTVTGGTMSVTVDGKPYLSAAVKLPASVLAAFTGACGGLNDIHAVSGVAITAPGSGGRLPTPGGGWSFNGKAAMTGAATTLTQAVANQAGAVLYPHAVSTASFSATFNVALGGGTGGEGMTLALLNTGSKWSSVGGSGQGLGFAGLNGLAVVLGTQQGTGAPSANFVGIEKGTAGGTPSFVATKALPAPDLRAGTHTVTVTLKSGTLTVTIDGSPVLTHAVTVPSSAFVAYTGGTGTLTDQHLVQDAAISAA